LAWFVWFILAGRGFGKTRSGAEHVVQFCRDNPGAEVGVIGRTDAEARRILLRGPSGLLACVDTGELDPQFGAGKGYVEAPGDSKLRFGNGAVIYVTGANSPDALRGLNLWAAWCDELASWRYQRLIWDEVLEPAVRIGPHPHILVTTTPKPTKLIRTLLKDEDTVVVRGSTFENAANLAKSFIRRMRRKYEGTRTGRQELYAEVLDDVPGALVTRAQLDASRVEPLFLEDGTLTLPPGAKLEELYRRAVVALDPADGTEEGDEQAIALVGLGYDHELYIEHTDGMRASPEEYLGTAVDLAVEHQATIVVEKNHGGRYLIATLDQVMRQKGVTVPVKVVTASDGKRTRAEPIVPLFTRNKLHFVGSHPEVEDQLCSWIGAAGEKSPDRMDAVVWGVTDFLRESLAPPDDDAGDGAYTYAQKAEKGGWADDYDDGTYDYA
jgi:predicted phage terminase large subunit-like protein